MKLVSVRRPTWHLICRAKRAIQAAPASIIGSLATPCFDKHDTLRKRSRRWVQKGIWQRLFEAVQDPDFGWVCWIRPSCKPAHRRLVVESRVGNETLGRSRGGLTTKIYALVDALGNPLHVVLGPSQRADCQGAVELPSAAQDAGNVLADKAYNTDAVLANVAASGAQIVIPSKKNRLVQRVIDRNLYRDRNKVERFFSRFADWPRVTIRRRVVSRGWCVSSQPCCGYATSWNAKTKQGGETRRGS